MGKASTSKKVARIASTGGGRTARGRTPWLWYGGLSIVLAAGILLVVLSRDTLDPTVERPNFSDHWHTAYGIFICDQFRPPMPQPGELIGLHTHTDGLIHVEPTVRGSTLDTGRNATVGRYESGQPGFKITETSIQYPGDRVYKNGDKCGSKPGRMEILRWENQADDSAEKVTGNPKDIRVFDQLLVTFAFVPEGTTVPKPPSVANLANPNANEGPAPQTPTSAAEAPPAPPAAPTSAP